MSYTAEERAKGLLTEFTGELKHQLHFNSHSQEDLAYIEKLKNSIIELTLELYDED